MKQVFPPALRNGGTIGIVAPAGVVDRTKLSLAIKRLEQRGFRIKTYRDVYEQHGYLAGSDDQRAAELMNAFLDPECDAIFAARGGNGCIRLVDMLDYEAIRANPTIFVGFSDNTVLHAAFARNAGLVTFHGPHPSDSYGAPEGATPLTEQALWRALMPGNAADATEHRIETGSYQLVARSPGVARGRLVGGNLSLISALMGTPHEVQTAGNILFIEDVGEPPYRIDRFLAQLKTAGHLDQIAGLILGQFTNCQPQDDAPSLSLDQVLHDYFGNVPYPVLANFPSGHQSDNVTLPFNVFLQLDADSKKLTTLECPVASA